MKRLFSISIFSSLIVVLVLSSAVLAQNDIDKLFKDTRLLSKKALSMAANIFSKDEFENGVDFLADAEALFKKNGQPEEIQQNLASAAEFFNKAMEKTKTLNTSFGDLMKIRQLALNVEGNSADAKIWSEGEDNFISAVEDYNDKDNEGFQKYAKKAESNYKDAELAGIKQKFLGDLKASIAQAEDKDLNKYAPIGLKKSKQAVEEIETILNANRYDTLKSKNVMKQAIYEINHGLYLEDVFKKMKDNDKTQEDLVLMWEEPLVKIAGVYKLEPALDKGSDELTSKIISNINSDQSKIQKLAAENQKLSSEIESLTKSVQDYKTKLADAENQNKKLATDSESLKSSLETANKSIEEFKTKFAQLESENVKFKAQSDIMEKNAQIIENVSKLFSPSEAEVNRNGDLIVIRLVNIVFPTGKATLEPQYFNLLAKVQKALQLFPNGTYVIEGHTDGQGDYQKNLDLSQQRANSVFQYFISSMGAEASKITTACLGGTKPIANNSTEEGRAKNRRIEIVVNPHFETAK